MSAKKSLKIDIMLSSFIIILLSILFTGLIILLIMIQFTLRESSEKNNTLAASVSFQVQSYLRSPENTMYQLEDILYDKKLLSDDNTQVFLDSILQNNPQLSNFFILDNSGKVLVTSPYDESIIGTDHSMYPYFMNSSSSDSLDWSQVFFSYNSKSPSIAMSLKTDSNIIVGILNLDYLGYLIQDIKVGDDTTIAITDFTGTYIAHSDMTHVYQREKDYFFNKFLDGSIKEGSVIDFFGEKIIPSIVFVEENDWSVIIYQSYSMLMKPVRNLVFIYISIVSVFIALSIFVSLKRVTAIIDSIDSFIQGTEIISFGNYDHVIPQKNYLELDELSNHFNSMTEQIKLRESLIRENEEKILKMNEDLESKVNLRTFELKKSNDELQTSLAKLKQVQNQLVESEKMAALGELVAGVAHELNTPIGNSITIASYIVSQGKHVREKIESNNLSKIEFLQFVNKSIDSSDILLSNMKKTSSVINLFKELSVDSLNTDNSIFNVFDALENVISSVKDKLEENRIKIYIICPKNLRIKSYKKAFSKLLLIFIANAIEHAFSGVEDREILIRIYEESSTLKLSISDNGRGISREYADQIFNPFFTTSRGKGKIGLGLNIAYNIVTRLLKGSISYETGDKGTSFDIVFPIK